MKKLICFIFGMLLTLSLNAQVATENAKFFDNTYVGFTAGIYTPLSFNQMFPINEALGLKVGKEFTKVFGIEFEGLVSINDHMGGHHNGYANSWGSKTAFTGINANVSGTANVLKDIIRLNAGIGWTRLFGVNYSDNDELISKTGIDFMINSYDKRHSLVFTPAIYWNLTSKKCDAIQFNKNHAYLFLGVSYLYHFRTSNGTYSFKEYDIDELNSLINDMRPTPVERPIVRNVVEVKQPIINPYIIRFAQASDELTGDGKVILDNIPREVSVRVHGYASPEGSDEFNRDLSNRRALRVANYLESRGVTVTAVVGFGSTEETSQRIVVVYCE